MLPGDGQQEHSGDAKDSTAGIQTAVLRQKGEKAVNYFECLRNRIHNGLGGTEDSALQIYLGEHGHRLAAELQHSSHRRSEPHPCVG